MKSINFMSGKHLSISCLASLGPAKIESPNISVHCVKSVQIRSYFWSVFFCIRAGYGDLQSKYQYSVRI